MNREIIKSRVGDECIHVKHKSGLEIFISEKPGFSTSFAVIGTKYGSVHTDFRIKGEEEFTAVPEGIAHFLEHKLFENEDSKVFELYAKTGASGNAYTTFDRTCYYFSSTSNYEEPLRILLDFVQKPYFTQETVDKEQGIISQEIKMTNDNPDWRVFSNLLKNMYHSHPVRTDIAGTCESIAKIDAPLLYRCYDAFYDLHNMVLSVAGNVKADRVLEICDELLRISPDRKAEVRFPDEPETVVRPQIREKMPVGMPIVQIGYKCRPADRSGKLKKHLTAAMACSLLTDECSELYDRLLDEGVISSPPGGSVFAGEGYFSVIFSAVTEYPERVAEAIEQERERFVRDGIPENVFKRIKRCGYRDILHDTDDVESTAFLMLDACMEGSRPYEHIDIYAELTAGEVRKFMEEELVISNRVLSVIEKEVEDQ